MFYAQSARLASVDSIHLSPAESVRQAPTTTRALGNEMARVACTQAQSIRCALLVLRATPQRSPVQRASGTVPVRNNFGFHTQKQNNKEANWLCEELFCKTKLLCLLSSVLSCHKKIDLSPKISPISGDLDFLPITTLDIVIFSDILRNVTIFHLKSKTVRNNFSKKEQNDRNLRFYNINLPYFPFSSL